MPYELTSVDPQNPFSTLDIIATAVCGISRARDLPELKACLSEHCSLLGFDRFGLSVGKPDKVELSLNPDISTLSEDFQQQYKDGRWYETDINLQSALSSQQGVWFDLDMLGDEAAFAELLGAYGIRTGVLLTLQPNRNVLNGMVLSSSSKIGFRQDILQAASIISNAALLKAEIIAPSRTGMDRDDVLHQLSTQQMDMLRWAADGKSNRDISSILGISKGAVDYHMARIFEKLGVYSKAQAIVVYINGGGAK